MEAEEHQQPQVFPLKKSAGETHPVGKGKLKLGKGKSALKMTGKGNSANLAFPSVPVSIIAQSLDSIPKKQRTKIVRRPAGAISAALARSSDVVVAKPEVMSEVPVEDAKVDPPAVESGDVVATPAVKSPPSDRMEED
jgi:hypothetical protein